MCVCWVAAVLPTETAESRYFRPKRSTWHDDETRGGYDAVVRVVALAAHDTVDPQEVAH